MLAWVEWWAGCLLGSDDAKPWAPVVAGSQGGSAVLERSTFVRVATPRGNRRDAEGALDGSRRGARGTHTTRQRRVLDASPSLVVFTWMAEASET